MFFRRSPRQSTPQTVQGEQADSASTSMPALELESVSVFTELPEGGHRRILKSVSLRFTAKRTAVLGLNGSGKSTLLGLFNGLTHPDEGIVRVNGVDTLQAPSRGSNGIGSQGAFEGVGMLFAQPEAQLIMPTVAEDIDLSLRRAASSGWRTRASSPSREAKSSWWPSPAFLRLARRSFCWMSRLPCWICGTGRGC